MATIATLGGADWFRLGDRDLAMHVERTRRLQAGETLSQITADICRRLGIAHRILPMSDDRVRTRVLSDDGWIDFQDYFVRQQCRPVMRELAFEGAATARAQPEAIEALGRQGARRGDLPVQSLHQHRADPCRARHAGRHRELRCAGGRGLADRRRQGGQGTDGEDDAGARPCRDFGIGCRALRQSSRRLHRRPGRCRGRARQGARRADLDEHAEDKEALARTVLSFADCLP